MTSRKTTTSPRSNQRSAKHSSSQKSPTKKTTYQSCACDYNGRSHKTK